jgi:thioredoxin reductase (NADPH)
MVEQNKIWDVIIIGAGPAGLTAAIYGARRSMSVLVLTKDIGGQMAQTHLIENYPGFEGVSGPELADRFHKQAVKWGAEFVFQGADEVIHDKEKNIFEVKTEKTSYFGHSIILTFGLEHRHLNVPGEKDFYGKGVTYCATCDGPLFKGKTITVVGGGNSALDAIDYMSKIATKVYGLVRGDNYKGEEVMVDLVKGHANVELKFNTEVTEVKGEKFVTSIGIKNSKTGEVSDLPVQGVFVEVGYQPNTKLYGHLVETTEQGAIIVDKDCNTSFPGFYAAGDVTTLSYKQIITSGGEGCKAVLTAYTYVQKKKGATGAVKADRTMA